MGGAQGKQNQPKWDSDLHSSGSASSQPASQRAAGQEEKRNETTSSTSTSPKAVQQPGSALRHRLKKKALAACGDLHGDLLDCFQKASMLTFKPICQEENSAFWSCYKRERGIDTFGAEKEMSFRQMFDDAKVYLSEQWGSKDSGEN